MIKLLTKILFLLLLCGTVWAETELELVAPGGGEVDLQNNTMKYNATGAELVVVRWSNYTLETKQLEYDRTKSFLKGNGRVKLTQKTPLRILRSEEMTADLSRDYFKASGTVNIRYDENTFFSGNRMEWDKQRDQFNLAGDVEVKYAEWRLTGAEIEGRLNSGLFTITGPVQANNKESGFQAGRVIFDRDSEKLTLQENPVLVNGKNELTATEIIYDLKTKKVSASGVVKTRMIE